MKTLDEVIEIASDWTNGFDEMSIEKQMLHYLKEYRSDKALYEADRKNWEDDLSQKLRFFDEARNKLIAKYKELDIGTLNNPLTWDELRTMEGKPVWVEFLNDDPWSNSWWVVGEVRKDDIIIAHYLDEAELCEDDLGELWQAYRKERR